MPEAEKTYEKLLFEVCALEVDLEEKRKLLQKARNKLTYQKAKDMIDSWPQWQQDYAKEWIAGERERNELEEE